jgi:hypothetical protein
MTTGATGLKTFKPGKIPEIVPRVGNKTGIDKVEMTIAVAAEIAVKEMIETVFAIPAVR